MALPSSTTALSDALKSIQYNAGVVKGQAQSYLTSLQNLSVSTTFVFGLLDRLILLIADLNAIAATSGLNTYCTANLPGYAGTMTTDITAVVNAAQACINWVVTNFPKDSTNTFLLAQVLNSDGTRTDRVFTPTQTAGLQTLLQAFIATIG